MSDVIKPRPGMNVSIKVGGDSLPQGGDVGDVLTKTESGAEWQRPTGGAAGVQTVNGIEPDENGNVNVEVSSDIFIDNAEVIDMLIELDALPAVTAPDGAIYTDENGAILMM